MFKFPWGTKTQDTKKSKNSNDNNSVKIEKMNRIDQVNEINLAMHHHHPELETPESTFVVGSIGITVEFSKGITIFHDSVCECVKCMCACEPLDSNKNLRTYEYNFG